MRGWEQFLVPQPGGKAIGSTLARLISKTKEKNEKENKKNTFYTDAPWRSRNPTLP